MTAETRARRRSGGTRGSRPSRKARPASASSSAAPSSRGTGASSSPAPNADAPSPSGAQRRRLRGPLDHARADRLPHPSRLRRQPRGGVRGAPRRRELRGDRARRRRHRLDRPRDARGQRGRTRPPVAAAARRADRRGRHHGRDQVRLRPRPRDRAQDAPRRAPPRRRAPGRRSARPFSARMRCRRNSPATAPAYVAEVADAMLPALAAEGLVDAVDGFCESDRLLARRDRAAFSRARKSLGLPVKLHAEQLSNCGGAALAAEFRRAVGRPSRIRRRGRRRGDGARGRGRDAAARRLLHAARDEGAAGRALPPPRRADGGRRPTAIPAPRR